MARPRDDEQTVSLFPFLSILACVIGVLTLLVMALALSQLDPEAVAEAERQIAESERRAVEHASHRDAIDRLGAQRSELEGLIAEAEAIRQRLDRARAELAALESDRSAMPAGADAKLLAELNRQRERAEVYDKRGAEVAAEIARLKAALAKLDAAPTEPRVAVRPAGSGSNQSPLFVECTAGGVVIRDGSDRRVPTAELAGSDDFAEAMAAVRDSPRRVMVFLVRPDATRTYTQANRVARTNQTKSGKLPIAGQGELDLSAFK